MGISSDSSQIPRDGKNASGRAYHVVIRTPATSSAALVQYHTAGETPKWSTEHKRAAVYDYATADAIAAVYHDARIRWCAHCDELERTRSSSSPATSSRSVLELAGDVLAIELEPHQVLELASTGADVGVDGVREIRCSTCGWTGLVPADISDAVCVDAMREHSRRGQCVRDA